MHIVYNILYHNQEVLAINESKLDNSLNKEATFLSTRTVAGSKLRRYRWRMMAVPPVPRTHRVQGNVSSAVKK